MTGSAPELARRLDELAADATAGIEVAHPAHRDRRPSQRPRLALIGVTAVLCLLAVFGGQQLIDNDRRDGDDGEGEAISAVDPDRQDAVELPERVRDNIVTNQPELDLSTAVVGPTIGRSTVYSLTTADGGVTCVYAYQDGAGDTDQDWQLTSTCSSTAVITTTGMLVGRSESPTEDLLFGRTTDDVIGVRVSGADAPFENQLFLFSDPAPAADIGLLYDPDRTVLVSACDSVGTVKTALSVGDRINIDTLTRLGRTFESLAMRLEIEQDVALSTGDEISEADNDATWTEVAAAIDTCERERVPGWAVVYATATLDDLGGPPNLAEDFDLTAYGEVQKLRTTASTSSTAQGPGLGPIARAKIEGLPVTAFRWNNVDDGQTCVHIDTPGLARTRCAADFDEPTTLDPVGGDDEPQTSFDDVHVWPNNSDAAFATATAGNRTVVQRAFGEFFIFALDGDGPVTLAAFDTAENELASHVIDR